MHEKGDLTRRPSRHRCRRTISWMREDGFIGETEAAPPEHRLTVEGSESVMGS